MVDFSDRKNIKRWLDAIKPAKRRREIAVALAARAALRVTPLLGVALTQGERSQATVLSDFVLSSLRATALSWAAAKYPAHGSELRAAALAASKAAAARAAARAATTGGVLADAIANAARAAAAAASLAPDSYSAADARAAVYAAAVVARAVGDDAAYAADADLIDAGRSGSELMGFPLWPNRAPDRATEAWGDLRAALLAADEGWKVWTEWYEARLDVGHPPNEALEIARATIPDEIWRQGPAVVNAEIKRLISEHEGGAPVEVSLEARATLMSSARGGLSARIDVQEPPQPEQPTASGIHGTSIPPIESIPEQERAGTRFGLDAQGLIDVLRIPPATNDLQRFHYDEMRHKAQQLVGLGQMLGDIAPAATRILEALPERIEDVSIDRLWSHGNTLRRRHDAHVRTIDSNLGPDPARLHPLVAANLGDFIDSFNVYVIGDPRGLELDCIRLGPQDREAARKVAALAAPIARAAGEPESPATPAAQETLAEQVSSAIDAPNDINGDQAAELARKTTGNFVSELLRGAYGVVTNEAKSAQKGVRDGLYRAAGAAAFAGLSGTAYYCWPFVVRHADALRAFVTEAYQNPKLVEIIDWLL